MLTRWLALGRRTIEATLADKGPGLAAQLAYYFLLALFPALLFVVALIGLLPIDNLLAQVLDRLSLVAPPDVVRILRTQLESIRAGEPLGLLTIGILGALWSSSAAMDAIIDTINQAYHLTDTRPFWKIRVLALGMTLLLVTFVVVSFALVVAGPEMAEALAARFGLGSAFEWTWKIVQWPVVMALVSTAMGIVYYFAPAVPQTVRSVRPGALLATVVWLAASLGFRAYVSGFSSINETYGTIGGIITLMLWFYLSGLAIIVGAELNSEIRKPGPR